MFEITSLPSSTSTSPAGNPDPDHGLVSAWVSRADERAFARLVERYQGYVFRLALSVLGPAFWGDAEDVTQEVFIRVAERLGEFRGDSLFRTWLYRLAFNMALDRRRRPRCRKPHVELEVLDRRASHFPADDPFVSAAAAERSRAIRGCLDALPETLRSVIHLRYWMDLQIEDIADVLHIPLGTVKSHLHRSRGMLLRAMRARATANGALGSAAARRRSPAAACLARQARAAW